MIFIPLALKPANGKRSKCYRKKSQDAVKIMVS
jgi:hypothetical protein